MVLIKQEITEAIIEYNNPYNSFSFKGMEINPSKMSYEIANNIYSDLMELFRVENKLAPLILQTPLDNFHDDTYKKLYDVWDRISHGNTPFERYLPHLSDLPLASICSMGGIKIAYYDHYAPNDFRYINYQKYANTRVIEFTASLKDQAQKSGSPNAVLYFAINSAALLKNDTYFTLHYTQNSDRSYQQWYGMHLPFKYDNYPWNHKGVISLIKRI